jgi:prepilin-type N-terminal cleavage/methylation domain-containing protein
MKHLRHVQRTKAGFTLLELLISLLVIGIVFGAAFTFTSQAQKLFTSATQRATMHGGVRSAAELIAQEISQAGSYRDFTNTASGDGILMNGICCDSTSAVQSNGTRLILIGNINDTVNTVAGQAETLQVIYQCDFTSNTMTRSVTRLWPNPQALQSADVLVDNLVPHTDENVPGDGGKYCFKYQQAQDPRTGVGTWYKIGVGLYLDVQTDEIDPTTNAPVIMRKSFLNLFARNVVAGYALLVDQVGNGSGNPPQTSLTGIRPMCVAGADGTCDPAPVLN